MLHISVVKTMSAVSVVRTRSSIDHDIKKLIQLAGGEDIVAKGDSVLLKPNIHAIQSYTTGGTTNPSVVAAVVKWAYERGEIGRAHV